ncbi:MAG TPA: hypothetical protein VMV75_11250 [Sulfuricella sp.]|nr:hypothetical protein [Sulfuricella sp.]
MTAGFLLAANSPRADVAGRFFYTPQERAALDAQRNKSVGLNMGGDSITVNGLVARSSGKSTVWINNTPQNDHETTSGIAVIGKQPAGGKVTLRPSGSSKPISMRVGQTLETGSGQIREIYEAAPKQEKKAGTGP